jgi:hypothetical protein
VNYLHGFENRAGGHLTMTTPTRGHQQVFDRSLLEWLGNIELKVPAKVLDCLFANVVSEVGISRLIEMQLVIANELSSLLYAVEVQSVPI